MNQVQGVDVSHWQGIVDFNHLKSLGKQFCFAKATDGATKTDIQFSRNRIEAKKAGLLFGAYHFFHPAEDFQAQVDHFEKIIGARLPGELPPVLDWETTDGNRISKGVQVDRAYKFCKAVEAINKCTPLIYESGSWMDQFGPQPQFAEFGLFVANYGVNHPRIPRPWTNYLFWQYSGSGGLDLDLFNGSMDQLALLAL